MLCLRNWLSRALANVWIVSGSRVAVSRVAVVRHLVLIAIEAAIFAFATLLAFFVRSPEDGLDFSLVLTSAYFWVSMSVAITTFYAAGTSRQIWRLSNYRVYLKLVALSAIIVLITLAISFTFNRLEGIPRSVPLMQGIFAAVLLISVRQLAEFVTIRRRLRDAVPRGLGQISSVKSESVLIVGVNSLTGVLLRVIESYASGRLDVIGFVGASKRHLDRTAYGLRVLGHVSQLELICRDLHFHGVEVKNIMLAIPFTDLPADTARYILKAQNEGTWRILEITDVMRETATEAETPVLDEPATADGRLDLSARSKRPYWFVKRATDILVAASALVIVSPVILIVSVMVGFLIGRPAFFWQRRPGMGGRPFNIIKFRTMSNSLDGDGEALPDDLRTNALGRFLRLTRIDELPQLLNILRGDMSIVGPRPLLPRDQSDEHSVRLTVRPGLTGWAQVVGGRVISADQKAALDIWYVYNASFRLDAKIILKTIPMVFLGERFDQEAVDWTLRDLNRLLQARPPE
jgi:lipopolysaccharide/colanic/teichoic acid biosynthesis glycosyltransferase